MPSKVYLISQSLMAAQKQLILNCSTTHNRDADCWLHYCLFGRKNKLKTTFNMNKAQNILNMVKYKNVLCEA